MPPTGHEGPGPAVRRITKTVEPEHRHRRRGAVLDRFAAEERDAFAAVGDAALAERLRARVACAAAAASQQCSGMSARLARSNISSSALCMRAPVIWSFVSKIRTYVRLAQCGSAKAAAQLASALQTARTLCLESAA